MKKLIFALLIFSFLKVHAATVNSEDPNLIESKKQDEATPGLYQVDSRVKPKAKTTNDKAAAKKRKTKTTDSK